MTESIWAHTHPEYPYPRYISVYERDGQVVVSVRSAVEFEETYQGRRPRPGEVNSISLTPELARELALALAKHLDGEP